MAGKQTKKVLRAWKRFTRRITRGGVPMQSPRHMPAAEGIELPPGPPLLIRQDAVNNIGPVHPQRLRFNNHPRRHTYHRTQPRTYRSLSPRTHTTRKRPHH